MGTPLQKRSQVAAGAGDWGGEANITRSAWFDGSADHLDRTPSSASTDRTRQIWGTWIRRTRFNASSRGFFGAGTGASARAMQFLSSHQFYWELVGGVTATSVMLFRDSEWFHFVASYDGNESTNADKLKVYINGEEIELTFAGTLPTTPQHFGDTILHTIGANTSVAAVIDGLMTQAFHVADASIQNGDHAITDFGESVAVGDNGSIWAPVSDAAIKSLVDAGGTNSFLLSSAFGDGTDDSAKGNDWTPTSMSDAANGSGDTPSNPYALFSELTCTTTSLTIAEGGLNLTSTNANFQKPCLSSFVMQTGKWFWMCELDVVTNNYPIVGISVAGQRLGNINMDDYIAVRTGTTVVHVADGASSTHSGAAHGLTITTGTVVAFAFDADTRTIWFGTVSGSTITWDGDPEAGTGGYSIDGDHANEAAGFVALTIWNNGGSGTMRAIYDFGQNDFALTGSTVTPPTGFNPQQPRYLPAPETYGVDLFNVAEYAGSGPSSQSITGLGFQPDFIWFKARNIAYNHEQYDSSRPITKNWFSSALATEFTSSTGLTSYDSDGFSLGSKLGVNDGSYNFVAWCWKVNGGTTAVNNDGDIESTVQVGEFMSMVTYLGNQTANQTVGHGLGAPPDMIIIKNRDDTSTAMVWFNTFSGQYLRLADNTAVQTGVYGTTMNSTVFEIQSNNEVNALNDNIIAYCFKNVPGVCVVGRYKGNGSTDGTFVHTGFRPRFIFIKGNVSPQEWLLYDTVRQTFNDGSTLFFQHDSSADTEGTDFKDVDILANGFKLRDTTPTHNQSGVEYYYMAIADVASGTGLPPIPGR